MISSPNRRHLFLLLWLSLSMAAFPQEQVQVERSANKVILEGKVYYIHVVKPGETLYAISKAYNISQKEISIENPGVVSGIQIGQALKIPVQPTIEEEIDTSREDAGARGRHTHNVETGETIYGIARMYGISESALREANPAVQAENLKPGQHLIIPQPLPGEKGRDTAPAYNEEGFAYHKVKRKETLYSIARFYGITVQDIRTANPELGWGGPKTGQVVRIPLPQMVDHPETALDTLPVDSLLRIRTDSLPEEYPYEELLYEHFDPDRTYRVAYFIPFDFQKPEPLDSLIKDVDSATRRNRIIERYRMEEKVPQAVSFLEFFQGSLLALDSMKQTGMKLDVSFFDTHKSVERTRSLLAEEGMEELDLIIGPFYPFTLEIVAAFARENRIPLVTPFYNELDYIRNNPYLFQLSPSMEREYREVAKLVASKYQYNIVYVREEDSLDVEKHAYLQGLIFDGFDDYRPEEPVIFKEMILTLEHSDDIIHSLSADRKNLVVVPTRNEALASRVVSALYYRLKDFEIEMIGTPFWTEFSSIDYRYYHELSLMFYNSFWMDYLDPEVDMFLRKYRDHFFAEPRAMTRKGNNYGIEGYDITLYFTNALRIYGHRFILSLDEYNPGQVLDPYRFSRVTSAGGYENTRITFYQFLPDMSIREFKVPELPERNLFFRPLEDGKRKYLNFDPDR
jgi:LysM repeat protein